MMAIPPEGSGRSGSTAISIMWQWCYLGQTLIRLGIEYLIGRMQGASHHLESSCLTQQLIPEYACAPLPPEILIIVGQRKTVLTRPFFHTKPCLSERLTITVVKGTRIITIGGNFGRPVLS
jgi:hypothetical protein